MTKSYILPCQCQEGNKDFNVVKKNVDLPPSHIHTILALMMMRFFKKKFKDSFPIEFMSGYYYIRLLMGFNYFKL